MKPVNIRKNIIGINNGIVIDEDWIRGEIEDLCQGSGSINGKQREGLINKFIGKVQSMTGKFVSAKRYKSFKKSIETHHLAYWETQRDENINFGNILKFRKLIT